MVSGVNLSSPATSRVLVHKQESGFLFSRKEIMPTEIILEPIEELELKNAPSAYGGDYGAPNLGQWGCL